jgi:hypothetical protein
MPIDQRQHAVDERLPLEVADLTKRDAAAEMRVVIGVAPRTAQWTFACDLDRKVRPVSGKNLSPGADYPVHA